MRNFIDWLFDVICVFAAILILMFGGGCHGGFFGFGKAAPLPLSENPVARITGSLVIWAAVAIALGIAALIWGISSDSKGIRRVGLCAIATGFGYVIAVELLQIVQTLAGYLAIAIGLVALVLLGDVLWNYFREKRSLADALKNVGQDISELRTGPVDTKG